MKEHRITVMFPVNAMVRGGAEQQLLDLTRGMDKSRFAPIVVSLYPGGALEPDIKNVPGVEYICLNRKGKFDFSILLKVFWLLRKKRVDIIQPFLTPSTFFGLLPALVNRTPVKIATERCGTRVDTHLGYKSYRMVEDFLTRFADWAIPNSDAGRRYLIGRGINPARIKVIYNGVNLQRLTPDPIKVSAIRESMGLPPGGMVVGITARLTPAKDPGTFLQAARIIHQAIPETRFGVLGDGPLKPGLENQARELGLAPYVAFFGDHQSDVGSYISVFDIACLSSKDIEGCSSVTVEAMSLGKPVVVTDVGGNRELVEHGKNGFLVPVQNPQAMADAVINYLRNPDKAREMGQYAKETAHVRFAMHRLIQDYENLYESSIRAKQKRNERT